MTRLKLRAGLACILACLLWGALLARQPVLAAPAAQNTDSSGSQHIYLLPGEQTGVRVEVHIAELWISASGEQNYVDVDATYRLKNEDRTPASTLIRIATASGTTGVRNLNHISNLSVTSGDAAIGLNETENGNYTFRTQTPADGSATLRLRYRVALGSNPLATVRYALEPLNRWPGEISIRIEVKAPDAIAGDSWTRVEPDGWSHGLATDPGRVDVKWLYNRRAPEAPIIFQYVNPGLWQQIRSLELTPSNARTFDQYRRLGELYRTLYGASDLTAALRERFFAQTIAANTAALSAPGADDPGRGDIHYRLAQLYRTHAPLVPEAQANEYAQLVVSEVAGALELLPPQDPRRSEMGRWRADGLRLLLNEARDQADWDRALAIVDELDALPEGSVGPDFIAQERDSLRVQKALQLLDEGQRDAAFAVAGPQLTDAQLEPPAQMHNIFARWALTVTATPDELHILALAQTEPYGHDAAYRSAQDMMELFTSGATRRSSAVQAAVAESLWDGNPALEFDIRLLAGTNTAFLANLMPVTMDWVLLRTLLEQLAVQVAEEQSLLRRTVTLSQPLDLRLASTQWNSMASSLERQAQEFETAARETDQGREALANRVRAVHYRALAERWRGLASQSRLFFEFRVGESLAGGLAGDSAQATPTASEQLRGNSDSATVLNRLGGAPVTRAWYTKISDPARNFTLQAQLLNIARLVTLVVLALGGILALSGLLWWLL